MNKLHLYKILALFFASLCLQMHGMDRPTSISKVFDNKDLVIAHIIPHISISSLSQLKCVSKNLDRGVGDIKKIVHSRLTEDYVLFWDFYYPLFGPQENTLALDDTHPKIQLLDELLTIHQESIKSDMMYYLKSLYLLVRDDSKISKDSMKNFVLGKDLPIESRLMFKGFVNETNIYTDNNYGARLRLLDKSIIINEKSIQEQLTQACHKGHLNIVKALLKRSADPNKPDELNTTPFYSACTGYAYSKAVQRDYEYDDQKFTQVINVLLQHGLDINQIDDLIPYIFASKCTHIIPILFQQGLDPNLSQQDGTTILHLACQMNDVNTVRSCIEYGAHVNQCNKNGESPLYDLVEYAAFREKNKPFPPESMDIVKLLLKNNANPNAQDNTHTSLLDLVNYRKPIDKDLKDILVQHGAKTRFQLLFTKFRWKIACTTTILIFILFSKCYFYYN